MYGKDDRNSTASVILSVVANGCPIVAIEVANKNLVSTTDVIVKGLIYSQANEMPLEYKFTVTKTFSKFRDTNFIFD